MYCEDITNFAVFREKIEMDSSLEQMALKKYKYFVGDLWERYY